MMLSQPEDCYKCGEILTFCECDEPITDRLEWAGWLVSEHSRLSTEGEINADFIRQYQAELKRIWAWIDDQAALVMEIEAYIEDGTLPPRPVSGKLDD